MSKFDDFRGWCAKRKAMFIGGASGVALILVFAGQTYREFDRFGVDPSDPSLSACLGLSEIECVEAATSDSTSSPDRVILDSTRTTRSPLNVIGDRQRRRLAAAERRRVRDRASTTARSTPSPSSPTSPSAPAPSSRPSPPTQTRPPSRRPSPSPPPSTRPTPTRPTPPPTATVTPTAPTTPSVPTTPPVVPQVPPNVPVPPAVQICTPFAGVNCPPGSRQAERTSSRGPGNQQDPVDPGRDPDNYDIDPTRPSEHVNGPNTGNNGEGHNG